MTAGVTTAAPYLAQAGDVVTVAGMEKLFKVIQVDELYPELARIWPLADDDEQPAQWIGRDVLKVRAHAHVEGQPVLWVRPGEVQYAITNLDAGICRATRKTLVGALMCWDHRITMDMFMQHGDWQLGEDTFPAARHADGTPPCSEHSRECPTVVRCPKCRAEDSLTVDQRAYGNMTTCTADGCDYSHWYDIGD